MRLLKIHYEKLELACKDNQEATTKTQMTNNIALT